MNEIYWNNKGTFKDGNMPKIDSKRLMAMGVRISSLIDVSPALQVIGKVKSGKVSYFCRPITATEVLIYSSFDNGETWSKLINGLYIPNAERLNDWPFIKLKYVIRSYLSTLQSDYVPRLFQVCLELSNLPVEAWNDSIGQRMGWRHMIEEPIGEWNNEAGKKMEWNGGIE